MALSPTSSRGGGGTAAPTTHEALHANTNTTIANGASARLSWTNSDGPDTLLDRSVVTKPTIITAGVYAVTVDVLSTVAMTVGGYFEVDLAFDGDGDDNIVAADSAPASAATLGTDLTIGLTYYLPAGATVEVSVHNFDGAADRFFKIAEAFVQRIA